ncbi:MAG: hypothetical protein LBV43_00690 [Prevotella sp.]|jgi:hypothetical protein|nr:hypothetical protein [Prevotella sp.]
MNKYFFTLVILVVSLSFTACSDDDKNEDKVIPTSEFVLGSPYRWDLPNKNEDVFLIVNSESEMYRYIESENETKIAANTPDFGKYTLLVRNVRTTRGISGIKKELIRHSEVDHTFIICAFTNETTVAENRVVAVTVPKLATNVQIGQIIMIKPSGNDFTLISCNKVGSDFKSHPTQL